LDKNLIIDELDNELRRMNTQMEVMPSIDKRIDMLQKKRQILNTLYILGGLKEYNIDDIKLLTNKIKTLHSLNYIGSQIDIQAGDYFSNYDENDYMMDEESEENEKVCDCKKSMLTFSDEDANYDIELNQSEESALMDCDIADFEDEITNAIEKENEEIQEEFDEMCETLDGWKDKKEVPAYEYVNQPDHYNMYCMPVIDMMEKVYGLEDTAKWCEITAWKYRQRMGTKPGESVQKDLDKEKWYLDKKREIESRIKKKEFVNRDEMRTFLDQFMKRLNVLAGLDENLKYDRNRVKPYPVKEEVYNHMMEIADEMSEFMSKYGRDYYDWSHSLVTNWYYPTDRCKNYCNKEDALKIKMDFIQTLSELANGSTEYVDRDSNKVYVSSHILSKMYDEADTVIERMSRYDDENPKAWTKMTYNYIADHYAVRKLHE